MRDLVDILGVHIDRLTLDQAEQQIWNFIEKPGLHMVFTPNSEMIMLARQDDELKDILNEGNLVTADGIGVVYASRMLGKPIKERVAGFDLATRIIQKMPKKPYSIFLLGGMPGVAEAAKENLEKTYPGIRIVGTHHGYFDEEMEKGIINTINTAKSDIVFVCLGMSRQEKWIYRNRKKLNARVCMGLGGSLDVFAGKVQRAPDFYCKYGLEWLYRLMKEPWRYKRMLVLPKFIVTVAFKGKRQ